MIDQKVKEAFFNELLKKGYSQRDGKKIWSAANRSLLHTSPELSKAFLKLHDYEPYKKNVFEKEVELIRVAGKKFSKKLTKEPFNLVDIGCADGQKAKEFIASLDKKAKIRYVAISPDGYLTNLAVKNLKNADLPQVKEYKVFNKPYEDLGNISSELRSNDYKKMVIFLHGSVLSSYEINDYLFELSRGMFRGDVLIVGNGIRSGERLVGLEKYQNPVFDKWFIHLMRSLGFKDSEVEYDARFGNSRVESFYRIKKAKTVKQGGKTIKFERGDEIVIFFLYKYYYKELKKFFKMYFPKVKMLKDKDNGYIIGLCMK